MPEDPLAGALERSADELVLERRARELDRDPKFPWQEFRALGAGQWLGLRVPERLGGRGLPLLRVAGLLYRLAHHAGTAFAKLSLQPEFSSVLAEHGSPELVDRFYRPLVRGELLIGNHVTEPGAGSDLGALATEAAPHGDGYLLTGTKSEAAFATDAQWAIVYARVRSAEPEGRGSLTAFLVPQDADGIRRASHGDLGERWMRRGTVEYSNVFVPTSHRIGAVGKALDYLRVELARERLFLGAIYLGVARRSWEETVRWAAHRPSFGRRLYEHEAVSFALVEDWARGDAAWAYISRVLAKMEAGESGEAESALGKWLAYDAAIDSIDHAIQFHGGRGYSMELPLEQRWRDVRSGGLAHGSSEILHVAAARSLWSRQ